MKQLKSQSQVFYTAKTLTDKKCQTCQFFQQAGACKTVESVPLSIMPSGSCILWNKSETVQAGKAETVHAYESVDMDLLNNFNAYKLTVSPEAFKPVLTEEENEELFQRKYEEVLADTNDPVKAILAGRGALRRKYQGLAVKQEAEGLTVAGWAIMFGDPVVKDSAGTYFSAEDTSFLLDYYEQAPLFMEHGFNNAYGLQPIGKRTKTQRFSHGIWLEHKLDKNHPLYLKTCEDVEAGRFSYSSDSIEHLVLNGLMPSDGKLSFWALAGCSLVPNPAEIGLGEVIALED